MFVLVFSWAITSTAGGKSLLLPLWSACVCVLIIVVTGLSVTDLIFSRMRCPQPGFFVSTTTTPWVVMNAAVFPPPPLMT